MNLLANQWSVVYLTTEWLIRIVMLVYVPQRRSPSAARAWLLLIFFLPVPAVLLYALVGRIYLPRQRIALQRQASHLIRSVQTHIPLPAGAKTAALPASIEASVNLAEQLGDYVAVGGNRIELLPGYELPLAALERDIRAARETLHILFYIFEADETGNRFAALLCEAAGRGVRCRVLMDSVGSRRGLRELGPRLKAAGIVVHAMLPVGLFRRNVARFDLRNHRKIVVIDGRIAYTGSQNIVNAEFIRGCPNEELVVRVEGPVVTQMQGVFLADWFMETDEIPRDDGLFPAQPAPGTSIAQVLPSGPGYGRQNSRELMIALIYASRREVTIVTPYFVPDEPFMAALISAARRGVRVQLILPRRSNQHVTHLAQQSYYSQLLAVGTEITLYEKRFLHAKHMMVDRELALVGTANMDIRSFALNAEVSLLVYDAAVVEALRLVCDEYMANGMPLDGATWSGRPASKRLLQNVARLADSLL